MNPSGNLSPRRREWHAKSEDQNLRRLLDEDSRYFLHQSASTPCLSAVRKAEGIWIEDMSGRRFMDFHGNNVHHIGYGHPRMIEAIKRQLDDLCYTPRRFTDEPAVAAARKIAEIAPGDLCKVLFAPSGSDAIDMALKLARAATGRFKTISFWDSFHGSGLGPASVSGERAHRSGPAAGPLLPGTEHVAPFTCYRCPYGYQDIDGKPDLDTCKMTCATFIDYVLEKEGDVAAVIAEPVRAVPYIPPPGFWRQVREACDRHGALLIFDEIPNGLGKTGRMFACEHDGVVPDILVLGKSLGGAVVPIAAMITGAELDIIGEQGLGHYTHEKNPITCRAALTTIEIIEDEGLVENARIIGAYALGRLQEMAARHPLIGDVRGFGLLLGVELVLDRETKTPATDIAEAIMYATLEKGLNLKVSKSNILNMSPPLIIKRDEMDRALDILDDCLGEAGKAL